MSRRVAVLRPGPLTLPVDAGRPGWAHIGVPRAGALDLGAAQRANTLVGNHPDTAVLEVTLGGLALAFREPVTIALTGADVPARAGDRRLARDTAARVEARETLALGAARRGIRAYLAVRGGWDVPAVLGSRSADLLSGLGPAALAAGQTLHIGAEDGPWVAAPALTEPLPGLELPAEPVLRVHPGPRDDWFAPEALDVLTGTAWAVTPRSNRVGLRLDGATLPRANDAELPSEGVVLGSVQVSHDGRPTVFLNDHPTTGGYPVIAVVDPADLWLCAQARPGTTMRMRCA
jgi:biotin-dependent carboxylase-like uncharacterized protein